MAGWLWRARGDDSWARADKTAFYHIPGVGETVDVADLIAVVGRNGPFHDTQPRDHELDDDFRVEVKIIAVQIEAHFVQGRHRIHPVTGMEFSELGAQAAVFEPAQALITDKLVERHTAV